MFCHSEKNTKLQSGRQGLAVPMGSSKRPWTSLSFRTKELKESTSPVPSNLKLPLCLENLLGSCSNN